MNRHFSPARFAFAKRANFFQKFSNVEVKFVGLRGHVPALVARAEPRIIEQFGKRNGEAKAPPCRRSPETVFILTRF